MKASVQKANKWIIFPLLPFIYKLPQLHKQSFLKIWYGFFNLTLRCPFSHRDASIAFFWTVYNSLSGLPQLPELHLKVKGKIIFGCYWICLQWQRVSKMCAYLSTHHFINILDHIKAKSYDYTWIKWLHNLIPMSTNYINRHILMMYLKIQHQIRYSKHEENIR